MKNTNRKSCRSSTGFSVWCSSRDSNPGDCRTRQSLLRFAQKCFAFGVQSSNPWFNSAEKQESRKRLSCFSGAPAGIRTLDTRLKRAVLYLLSYWGIWLGWRDSNPLYRSQSPVCYHYTTSQYVVPVRGFEPLRCYHGNLNPTCLPFHHTGVSKVWLKIAWRYFSKNNTPATKLPHVTTRS